MAAAAAGDIARLSSFMEKTEVGKAGRDGGRNTVLHWLCAAGNEEEVARMLSRLLKKSGSEGEREKENGEQRKERLPTAEEEKDSGRQRTAESESESESERYGNGLRECIGLNAQNALGDTPLHRAAWGGHGGCCRLLLTAGADTEVRNRAGKRPCDIARASAFDALAHLMDDEEYAEEDGANALLLNLSDTEYDEEEGEEEEEEEDDDGWTVEALIGKQRLERLFQPPSEE
eukprot:CAMPEP_0114611922 /NCGR_PEP_ID=MMETSP0168-20121206/4362_1 /TAXON_ID=95228 ORGANISM="Vannella sp., Strain DIVA3 517/6/12" /NCGR_SAMPLE_ID=MMETSP0168 /ASSEMBLY_ACC=CAM_ASM_000044 /LENGTH=231 /DNA_ID=CAMNT_0001822903 /DNA_START=49 /DNA_END=744 /DNA_ORIENTATION=+